MLGLVNMMGKVSGGHFPMMGGFSGMGMGWMWLGGIFWIVTWGLVVAVLIALLRWLWKKGKK